MIVDNWSWCLSYFVCR